MFFFLLKALPRLAVVSAALDEMVGLTILAMSADVHKQTSLLQGLLHTALPLIIAHVCHPVSIHRKDLISNLNLTELRCAACIAHMHYTQNKCSKLLKTIIGMTMMPNCDLYN